MRYKLKLEDYLTIAQAAAILDRRHQTVWGWIKDGKLPAERVGNQWLISPDDCRVPKAKKSGRPRKSEPIVALLERKYQHHGRRQL
jgi:excisionase family DNA binding protein